MARSSSTWSAFSGSLMVGLVILACVGSVISIKCYVCSEDDGDCEASPLKEEECSPKETFCSNAKHLDGKLFLKKCAKVESSYPIAKGECKKDDTQSLIGCRCDTDLCNGGKPGNPGDDANANSGGGKGGGGTGHVVKPVWLWTHLLWIGGTLFYIMSKDQ